MSVTVYADWSETRVLGKYWPAPKRGGYAAMRITGLDSRNQPIVSAIHYDRSEVGIVDWINDGPLTGVKLSGQVSTSRKRRTNRGPKGRFYNRQRR